ncbi:ATP-binding cassette domain-containing protein [Neofamilia massiliensis]|uniref:ATP-binding cassette domain-containing protein n=1 Tax=Neofamilia massiliensis TaxID=1673724 RepID=UPI0006BB9294|nr:ATP-binding cassette domain-containing protein [Neofamilia massiliensis]
MEILLKNINKSFKDRNVLKDLNLKIEEGEKLLLTGPSGIGKTTLLKILALIDRDFTGEYYIDKKDISTYKEKDIEEIKRNISYMFQEYALIEDESVYENVLIPLYFSKSKDKESQIKKILKIVQLDEYINDKVSILSGGQRQRVALARSLAVEKDIIILDEPINSLDIDLAKSILDWLMENYKNSTIIITGHDIDFYKAYNFRIVNLNNF